MTNAQNISIHLGCFYNPSIDEINNCLTTEKIAGYFSDRETGDYKNMIDYLNKMGGATEASVGIATIQSDLDVFIAFVKGLKDQIITA